MPGDRKARFRSASLLLALCCWALTPQASARNLDFRFIDVEYSSPDVDESATLSVGADSLRLDTDEDRGYRVAAAWELLFNVHVFGEYAKGENDYRLTLTGPSGDLSVSDNFDLARGRLGLGYGLPIGERWAVYGRVTWDYIDVDDIGFDTLNLGDEDDNGVGAEIGVRWMLLESVELQGWGRYSDVGDPDVEEGFDDDMLGGFKARWYPFGAEDLTFQVGYEFGEINTFNGGLRFVF